MKYMNEFTTGNSDNIATAVAALSIFTHNFCMDVSVTESTGNLTFRCDECEFHNDDGVCLVKKFANHHKCEYSELVGSMSR